MDGPQLTCLHAADHRNKFNVLPRTETSSDAWILCASLPSDICGSVLIIMYTHKSKSRLGIVRKKKEDDVDERKQQKIQTHLTIPA